MATALVCFSRPAGGGRRRSVLRGPGRRKVGADAGVLRWVLRGLAAAWRSGRPETDDQILIGEENLAVEHCARGGPRLGPVAARPEVGE